MSAESIGERFRAERERQQLDFIEIAARTKINRKFLEAIEAGDFKGLPGSFFGKSFVRQYASVLGLEWSAIERDLTQILEPEPLPTTPGPVGQPIAADKPEQPGLAARSETPVRTAPIRVPPIRTAPVQYAATGGDRPVEAVKRVLLSFVVFILVLVGCSVIYSVWQKLHNAPQSVKPAPTQQQPSANPSVSAPPAFTSESPALRTNTVNTTMTEAKPVLDLSATEDTWVSVSSSGRTVFMGVLKPSETKTLEGIETARLLIGNAGGLQVRWKGRMLGPFGPRGQVRIVQFTPDSYQVSLPHDSQKPGSQL